MAKVLACDILLYYAEIVPYVFYLLGTQVAEIPTSTNSQGAPRGKMRNISLSKTQGLFLGT